MSRQRDVRLLVRNLMDRPEYKHLSFNDIMDVVYWSQFGFLHNVMTNGDAVNPDTYKSVRLKHFASFIAHPKKVEIKINSKNKDTNDEHN